MAIPIAGEAGELVDSHGGRADLSAGVIRILHPQSFRDDPTRIFRAVRYAARFGFSMDEATRAAMAEALTAGAMATLTPDRVR
ncbi:MAG: CCA tRNA nucleotidyltransferase, partial [Dehalococcoidia bacterium]|nr:CCA tRNA nucleotidyltransferase [Dehalococcoidia bacterium]